MLFLMDLLPEAGTIVEIDFSWIWILSEPTGSYEPHVPPGIYGPDPLLGDCPGTGTEAPSGMREQGNLDLINFHYVDGWETGGTAFRGAEAV